MVVKSSAKYTLLSTAFYSLTPYIFLASFPLVERVKFYKAHNFITFYKCLDSASCLMDPLNITPLWHAKNIFCPTCDSIMAQPAKKLMPNFMSGSHNCDLDLAPSARAKAQKKAICGCGAILKIISYGFTFRPRPYLILNFLGYIFVLSLCQQHFAQI